MKILLIDPPFTAEEIGGSKQNFKYALNRIPSLGLGYLAAVAQKKGHTVKVIDCAVASFYKSLVQDARLFEPSVVGITATTPTFKNAVFIASILRKILPDTIFICGGAHPTACPQDSLDSGAFDFLVIGEGEDTFVELIAYFEDKKSASLDKIDGIAFRRDSEIAMTAPRKRIDNLNSLPFPARHLFPPLKAYRPTPASYRKLPLAVIMTSRGCPSFCSFCDRSIFGEKFKQRSVDNVIREVEEAINTYGAKEIRFFDDTFTVNHVFVSEFCKEIKKINPVIPWTCLTKVDNVSPDLLSTMRRSGCWQILFGLESADEKVLKNLGKNTTVSQNREAVLWAKKAGLSVRADFLVGTPWETRESFKKTVDFAKSIPLDFAHFNKFVPLPGTKIYKDLVLTGHKINFDKGASINNQVDFSYIPPDFSEKEYRHYLNRAYKEFYFRPEYILKKLLSIRTFTEFSGYCKGFYSVLKL